MREDFVELAQLPGGVGTGAERTVEEWIDLISPMLGWSSPGAFLTQLEVHERAENAHILLLIRGEGRSYAVSHGGRGANDSMPVAACYLAHMEAFNAATIAHETLHLYGAWDLYYEEGRFTLEQAEHARRLFGADIMLMNSRRLGSLEVTALTAWRVGWVAVGPEWFEFFAPELGREPSLGDWMERPPDHAPSISELIFPTEFRRETRLGRMARMLRSVVTFLVTRASATASSLSTSIFALKPAILIGSNGPRRGPRLRTSLGGVSRPRVDLRQIERLYQLDPRSASTWRQFEVVMHEVLAANSLAEADSIARQRTPDAPTGLRGGASNAEYRELRVELESIRIAVRKHGVAGVFEEERLRRSLQVWRPRKIGADTASPPTNPSRIDSDYRQSVLILDSIARRDVADLRRSVLRFNHLCRQLNI